MLQVGPEGVGAQNGAFFVCLGDTPKYSLPCVLYLDVQIFVGGGLFFFVLPFLLPWQRSREVWWKGLGGRHGVAMR